MIGLTVAGQPLDCLEVVAGIFSPWGTGISLKTLQEPRYSIEVQKSRQSSLKVMLDLRAGELVHVVCVETFQDKQWLHCRRAEHPEQDALRFLIMSVKPS